MRKKDKARELIFKGILMHLRGVSLKDLNQFYEEKFYSLRLNEKDKALIKFITLTTIRNRGIIENIMNKYLKKPLKEKMLEPKSGIMLGISQILFSRIPSYASVNTVVDLFYGKNQKWKPLVNALLRKVVKEKITLMQLVENKILNIPFWLKNSWFKQFGKDKAIKIINSIFEDPTIDIKVKSSINDWKEVLDANLICNDTLRIRTKGDIKKLKGFKEGKWWIQDIAAQLPVKIMGEIKDKKIIELGAAPGGKTAQMLNKGAIVTSIEISKKRTALLKKNLNRLNFTKNNKIICEDARKWIAKEKSDITIVDVPCSSTGTLRKNPDVMWHKKEEDINKLKIIQLDLLNTAINLTTTNGIIIYSSCSLQFEEGEEVIKYFLDKKLVKLLNIRKEEINGYPKEILNKGLIRTLPYMYNKGGMDGFFIARMLKI